LAAPDLVALRDLLARFRDTPEAREIGRGIADRREIVAAGLWGASDALLLATLKPEGATLVVTPDEDSAEDLAQDLRIFLEDEDAARIFPAFDSFEANGASAAGSELEYGTLAGRLLLLQQLLDREAPRFLVATAAAVLQPVPDPGDLARARRKVARGDRLDLGAFQRALTNAGFNRTPMVEAPGEFSVRGGILDVFPLSREAPYRVEMFDDEVDSIRQFEPGSQRSVGETDSFQLTLLEPGRMTRPDRGAGLLDYLGEGRQAVVAEERRIREWVEGVDQRSGGSGLTRRLGKLLSALGRVGGVSLTSGPVPAGREGVAVPVRSVTGSARNAEDMQRILEELTGVANLVLLFGNNDSEQARLTELLDEMDFPGRDRVEVRVGRLSRSFFLPELGLAFLSHDQLFDRYRLRRAPRRAPSAPVTDFVDLKKGDHVVHLAHGIGVYRGLERIVKRGQTEEFLKVEFADGVKVYVPVTKASLVQKYIGARDFQPRLSKVGGVTWGRQKDRVREAVKDLAADLLELQAIRAAKPGIPYPEDDRMQREFEGSFLYEDTPDQIEAGSAIKLDMQAPRPTDRLLCGDVGYGKTELAIRAAFKAVCAGKQVAVLVPTTVLAQQHFQTFTDRLVDYPVIVEALSRFRSAKEQKSIVERTGMGTVDILIGTHRLLSKDVRFADLGLVIIDEEQRFGVAHKTRLRQLRKMVDVLTMTATPIPRTLHMALLGIKDISTLSTPPPGRQSIQTEVIEFHEDLIRTAFLREINRGGQIFFVHNRVETIEQMAKKLAGIVPEARYAVVHGQMKERELEKRMLAFIRGEVDVLVTTTIIESGLDIPNANTIFLDRADRFGLAEMHQLRGRVGRYRHRAYCYLIVPSRRVSTIAERRIRAVEEFQDLGAGFRIAMRDLEIRGAGNILGSQQSGHIAAVGYELFCQLLDEAVRALTDEGADDRTDPYIELDVGARLPAGFVPDEKQKIEVYKLISRAPSEEDLRTAVEEVRDRFGPLPEEAELLVTVARVRLLAAELRVDHIVRPERDRVLLRPRDMRRLLERLSPVADRVRVVDDHTVHLLLSDRRLTGEDLLDDIRRALGGTKTVLKSGKRR
jgi:transcription-repair coupling factor (superfamily II helicase)